jgi:hypothetical protein
LKKNEENNKMAMEVNQFLGEKFKDYNSRASSEASSDSERANQKIQEQFYGEEETNNSLPFHVDINNPPIKK